MWNGQPLPPFGWPQAFQQGVANPAGMQGTTPGVVDSSMPQLDPTMMQLIAQQQMLTQQVQQINHLLSQMCPPPAAEATPVSGQGAAAAGTATPQAAGTPADMPAQGTDQAGPNPGWDPYDQHQGSSSDPWTSQAGDPWGGFTGTRRAWSQRATGPTQTNTTAQQQSPQQPTTTPGSGNGPTSGSADTGPFAGKGAKDASSSITGVAARQLLEATKRNVATRLAEQQSAAGGWRNVASVLNHRDGKKECPGWDGKDPGKTLRPWLRSQLFWQARTPTQPDQWGVALFEALPKDTLARKLAETIPDPELMSSDASSPPIKLT